MLLIGFAWVIVSTVASLAVKFVVPGRWEDHGPTVMMVVATGSFFGGCVAAVPFHDSLLGTGPASTAAATYGVVGSIVGGLVCFIGYAVDARKRVRA